MRVKLGPMGMERPQLPVLTSYELMRREREREGKGCPWSGVVGDSPHGDWINASGAGTGRKACVRSEWMDPFHSSMSKHWMLRSSSIHNYPYVPGTALPSAQPPPRSVRPPRRTPDNLPAAPPTRAPAPHSCPATWLECSLRQKAHRHRVRITRFIYAGFDWSIDLRLLLLPL